MSDRFGTQRGKHDGESYDKDVKVMSDVLQKNNIPYFYWTNKPINKTIGTIKTIELKDAFFSLFLEVK